MAKGKFGTAINCMDGRVQLPVIEWLKSNYQLNYVDMITEPGADKIMAEGGTNVLKLIKDKVLISIEKHHSEVILVAGHDDCAGNPVSEKEHRAHIKKAVKVIHAWKLPVGKVIGVWIDDSWHVDVVEVG